MHGDISICLAGGLPAGGGSPGPGPGPGPKVYVCTYMYVYLYMYISICVYVHVPGTVLWQLGNVLWQLGKDEKGGTLAGRQGGKGVERVLLACCLKGVGFWTYYLPIRSVYVLYTFSLRNEQLFSKVIRSYTFRATLSLFL